MFRASSCPSSGATTTAVAASGLPSELGDSSAVGRGRANCDNRPDYDQQHCQNVEFVCKRQVINLRSCCILLVDSVESMMMHGLANPKFKSIYVSLVLYARVFTTVLYLRHNHYALFETTILSSDKLLVMHYILICHKIGTCEARAV